MTNEIDQTEVPTLDCRRVRVLLGVSVLGLTQPAEEQTVQEHCAVCADCATARAELEVVVPLLATVTADDAMAGLPEPRPELLRRVVAETRAEERREARAVLRRRLVLGLGAAGLAAAAALVVSAAPWQSEPAPPPAAQKLVATAVDPDTGAQGSFTVTPADTGSQLWMDLSHVTPGDECHLVARSVDGQREVTASWIVGPDGTATLMGHTSWPGQDIAMLSVVDEEGRVLLRVSQEQLSTAG
jgi:hypothetical protein